MTHEERRVEVERQFEEIKAKRERLLEEAEDCMTEINRLQGEWRLLNKLIDEEPSANPDTELPRMEIMYDDNQVKPKQKGHKVNG